MALRSNIQHVSVNALAKPLLKKLIKNAKALGIEISRLDNGCTIVDAGIKAQGSVEAGLLIAEICMGGLGKAKIKNNSQFKHCAELIFKTIEVHSETPVLACLGSQYAGWALQYEKFFSLGSGPARAIAQREELFKELNYQDIAQSTVLVLETDQIPPTEIIEKVANDTQIKVENLTFILTPTRSLAGTVQIVGRVLEVALHKAHTLHFPLAQIISGSGSAPIPPISADFLTAMGRTNDAILFGGVVQLQMRGSNAEAEKLARELPSSASKDYGKPFAEVFKAVNMDFYQIDPLLFSPAKVTILNVVTGKSFVGGELNEALLKQSFT
ncbi:MAG: methenyltetrahydromethanopterin cyclohydrolase [Methylotenera sp.]